MNQKTRTGFYPYFPTFDSPKNKNKTKKTETMKIQKSVKVKKMFCSNSFF